MLFSRYCTVTVVVGNLPFAVAFASRSLVVADGGLACVWRICAVHLSLSYRFFSFCQVFFLFFFFSAQGFSGKRNSALGAQNAVGGDGGQLHFAHVTLAAEEMV